MRERTPQTQTRPSPLGRRRWRWGAFAIGWALLGVVLASPTYIQVASDPSPVPWSKVISVLLGWYLWGLLVPLFWWLVRRFPLERRSWRRNLAIHVALGILASLLYCFLDLVKITWVESWVAPLSFRKLYRFDDYWLGGLELYLAVYFAIVAVLQAISYYEKYRERELKASRLETQLALSHLELLKTQLHPHFLFNTLNAISALMHKDVDAADRMIALLADLLRLAIDKDERHQVPLHTELEFLERYLEIEKIRFRDRLRVTLEIEPECLGAQVPKLILQPLVENSIRHGIAVRAAAGRVEIHARRRGDHLDLVVSDDGPGLPQDPKTLREGVGLANTRARLEQLYGDEHRFEMGDGPTGGLRVLVSIPFEREARYPVAPRAVASAA